LIGVLMAVHAFVPVAALHHQLEEIDHPITRSDRFARRRSEVLASNARGFTVLDANAEPSAAGRRVLADLHALQSALEAAFPVSTAQSGGDF
jgi:HEXXH motif-containing protein